MKICMAGKQATIDAADLGELLDLFAAQVQESRRAGKINTRYEAGEVLKITRVDGR